MESEARLPLPLNSFTGRQIEIESLSQLLVSGARLISLTGPGAVGKTRLALEFTAQNTDAFIDGVFFVSLQALTKPGQVLEEIASVLRVRESGNRPLIEDLCDALADKHALICIDNWEHVLDAAPQLADLLAACRRLHVMATSREALRLQGEQEFLVHPLSLPARDEQHPLDVVQAEAVQLFVARAKAVKPGFAVDASNALVIGEICVLLDGLPLAIELAAALMRLFSPQALLVRLKDSPGLAGRSPTMQIVAGGSRDLPARQQTLRGTIEWSYNLLDAREQRLFRWLAIFAGGCDLEAVEAVCGSVDTESRPMLDLLIALVDQNLLLARELDGEPRFEMLRTIQEYAAEQLVGSGELHDVQQRHAHYYLDLAEHGDAAGHGPSQAPWQARMGRNHDNLRALLTWSLAQPERASIAYRLGEALWRFWSHRGYWTEARQWLTHILALEGDVSPVLKAKVLRNAGVFATQQGDFDLAEQYLVRSLSLARSAEDKVATRNALNGLGTNAYLRHGYATAIAYFQASLVLDRELEDRWGVAKRLNGIGNVLLKQMDFDNALAHVQQSLAMMRELGDAMEVAECLLTLGEIALGKGADGEAYPYLTECKTIFNDLQDPWGVAATNHGLGLIALHRGKLAQAQILFSDSLRDRQALGDKLGIAESLEALACLAAEYSWLERAARLWGAATALRSAIGASLLENERVGYAPYVKAVRTRLRERQFDAATYAGAGMSLDQVLRLNYGASHFGQIASLWTARPVPAALVVENADGWTAPDVIQSSGPYVLKQWAAGEKIELVKNPFWYGWSEQAGVTGNIDVVDMIDFDDQAAAFAGYQDDELDTTIAPLAEIEAIADPQSSFAAEYSAVPENATSYLGFITQRPAVSDARVRRALSMAIDRETMVRDYLKGGQIPANAFTNPLNFGSAAGDPAVAAWALSADEGGTGHPAALEMAKQLMTEAGFADGAGLRLVFAFEAAEEAETVAQAVTTMWQTAFPEIEITLQPQEWEVFLDTLFNPEIALEDKPDVYSLGWFADYPHANNWLHEVFSPSQSMNELMLSPDDPQVGDLVAELDATTIAAQTASEAEQIELYKRAEQLLVDEIAAVSPLFYTVSNHLTKPWLTREYNVLPYFHRWVIDIQARTAAQQ